MTTCPWPIDIKQCCDSTGYDPENTDDAQVIEKVVDQVSAMLTAWSGQRFGGCSTVRPLDPCGECRQGCCSNGDCIVLHGASGVTEVRMGGQVVDPMEYNFDPQRGVLCAVPPLKWPTRDPRHERIPSLEVDVMIGEAPDAWALAVASELACELLASCKGNKCRLPRNATTVSSQGVTMTLTRDELLYALPSISAWVNAVNPHSATSPARVLSPEARAQRVMGRAPIRF